MRRRRAALWIASLSTTVVVLVAVVDVGRTSPGPLTTVHSREPELAGKDGCSECHGGWFSSMTDACLECHTDIGTELEQRHGLHGVLDADGAEHCSECHGEHNGPGFPLVNARSFAHAGVESPEAFDHRSIGFPMDGKHLELDCGDCHANARHALLARGEKRYLGLRQDCATCHEDVHHGRMVVACAACHGQTTWDGFFSQGHERHLALVGGHADLSCTACHPAAGPHSIDALGTGVGGPPRSCTDCHESPHQAGFVGGIAALAGRPGGEVCVVCHAAEHTSFRDERLALSPEQHARSGFALDPPHDEAACADCHAPAAGAFAARYPGRGADTCSSCHEDPHGGQFASGPFSTGDCLACHERTRFEPHTFTAEEHARASLALDGAHATTACDACHADPPEGTPRRFHGTSSDCGACHADAHGGFFAPFTLALPAVPHGDCGRCHATTTFAELPAAGFDHGRWTGFPVRGAHEEGGCAACHPPTDEPDDAGRTFGRVAERVGTHPGCVACHPDPHQGAFDRPELPRTLADRSGCARCHDENSFRSFPSGFDHGRWTGFSLVGAHDVACSACHAPLGAPDEHGRTWASAAGPGCEACHANPHAGQFAVDGRTDCRRCHTDDFASFSSFDHERDSRFSLGEAHRGLACDACHKPTSEPGLAFVRYRPLGLGCSDCHASREEVLLRKRPKKE